MSGWPLLFAASKRLSASFPACPLDPGARVLFPVGRNWLAPSRCWMPAGCGLMAMPMRTRGRAPRRGRGGVAGGPAGRLHAHAAGAGGDGGTRTGKSVLRWGGGDGRRAEGGGTRTGKSVLRRARRSFQTLFLRSSNAMSQPRKAPIRRDQSSRGSKENGTGLPMVIFLKSGCAGLSR